MVLEIIFYDKKPDSLYPPLLVPALLGLVVSFGLDALLYFSEKPANFKKAA
jgi:hypothetical protein